MKDPRVHGTNTYIHLLCYMWTLAPAAPCQTADLAPQPGIALSTLAPQLGIALSALDAETGPDSGGTTGADDVVRKENAQDTQHDVAGRQGNEYTAVYEDFYIDNEKDTSTSTTRRTPSTTPRRPIQLPACLRHRGQGARDGQREE